MSIENKIKDLQDEISKLKAEKAEKEKLEGGAQGKPPKNMHTTYKLPKATVALRRRCAI